MELNYSELQKRPVGKPTSKLREFYWKHQADINGLAVVAVVSFLSIGFTLAMLEGLMWLGEKIN